MQGAPMPQDGVVTMPLYVEAIMRCGDPFGGIVVRALLTFVADACLLQSHQLP